MAEIKYAFVLDADGNQLSPTKEVKAWYMIRKGKAKLVSKYPMVIQLKRTIPTDEICKDEVRCGIDDGSVHTGIALVQKCKTYNKVVFKGTIEHRKDVKHLMEVRSGYRRYHRRHKRYRPARFNNRSSSRNDGRVAPSILQKKQATLRVILQLRKWIRITSYWLEDVAIDIRALTDGFKSSSWQYQKSNRLDENIRKAVILRDKCKCQECGKFNCRLEVHHIKARRLNGSNTLKNLITLCTDCHQKTEGIEEQFESRYYKLINSKGDTFGLNYASHVMIGKTWLRSELFKLGELHLTTGGDTANKRIDWNIEKSHSNDAICITDLCPDTYNIFDWIIQPRRRKRKSLRDNVLGMKHGDLVEYKARNGTHAIGIVTVIRPDACKLSIKTCESVYFRNIVAKSCRLLFRFDRMYFTSMSII